MRHGLRRASYVKSKSSSSVSRSSLLDKVGFFFFFFFFFLSTMIVEYSRKPLILARILSDGIAESSGSEQGQVTRLLC